MFCSRDCIWGDSSPAPGSPGDSDTGSDGDADEEADNCVLFSAKSSSAGPVTKKKGEISPNFDLIDLKENKTTVGESDSDGNTDGKLHISDAKPTCVTAVSVVKKPSLKIRKQ